MTATTCSHFWGFWNKKMQKRRPLCTALQNTQSVWLLLMYVFQRIK